MQISKEKLEEMCATKEIMEIQLQQERENKLVLGQQIGNFNNILEKIIRAADGLPLTDNSSHGYSQTNGYSPHDEQHNCNMPSEIEVLRYQLAILQGQIENLGARLAAVRAVAEFAQEHKA